MLKAESLSYRIGSKWLIKNINLSFHPGVLYGVLGPNGSGKSTFLKTLAGIWKPWGGRVLWKGDDLHLKGRREISQTISLVPQTSYIPFDFTVEEVVAMGRYPYGMRKSDAEIVENALKSMDVWTLRNNLITQISSGERQRAYIARSLVTESPILLLDEPSASLDIRHQLEIWGLLRQLKRQGKVMIVTIHDLAAAEQFCDEISVMYQGENIAAGTFNEVMTPSLLGNVFGISEDSMVSNHEIANGKRFSTYKCIDRSI